MALKKVLIITYYWPPSGGAGVQRWLKFVKYLPEFGVQPIVLTVDEHQAGYPVIDESLSNDISPDVEVYKTNTLEPFGAYQKITGQKQLPFGGFANEAKPSFKQRISRFIRGNFFIPDPRRGWNRYAFRKACALIEQQEITTVITSSPPHSSQLIGLQLKKKYPHINWVADLRDPWTDIYYYHKLYHTAPARAMDLYYERSVLQNADRVLVVSNAIKQLFASKYKLDNKIAVIPNGYDEGDFTLLSTPPTDTFTISYTGTLATEYPLESLVDAIAKINKEQVKPLIHLRFVGSIAPGKQAYMDKQIGDAVTYISQVPHSESISYLMSTTALLLIIPEVKDNAGILTGKLFEYLAANKPIIAIGPPAGDAAAIINECAAGTMFDKNDSTGIATYLQQLVAQWKTNPNLDLPERAQVKSYSRKGLTEQLKAIL